MRSKISSANNYNNKINIIEFNVANECFPFSFHFLAFFRNLCNVTKVLAVILLMLLLLPAHITIAMGVFPNIPKPSSLRARSFERMFSLVVALFTSLSNS